MKKTSYIKIATFLAAFIIISAPFFVSAAVGGLVPDCNTGPIDAVTGNYKNPCNFNYAITLINNVIKFLLFTIATPLAAIAIAYAGFLLITSGGSSEKVTKAKTIATNLVIGYVIALAAWLIVHTIFTTLKVDPTIETYMDIKN
jgi:hypothetical protein